MDKPKPEWKTGPNVAGIVTYVAVSVLCHSAFGLSWFWAGVISLAPAFGAYVVWEKVTHHA